MFALLAATLQAQQEARKIVHRVYEGRELSLALQGDSIRKIDAKTYSITGLAATLYTRPSKVNPNVRRIDISADGGLLDDATGRLTLRGRVRLVTEDKDDLQSDSLTLDRTRNRLMTDQPFTLTRPNMVVTGEGLEADDAFTDVRVNHNSKVVLQEAKLTTVLSTPGVITITPTPTGRDPMMMLLPDHCSMVRTDETAKTSKLTAARAFFLAGEVADPNDPTQRIIQITSLTAFGNVQLTGAEDELTTCDRLEWNRRTGTTDLWRGATPILIRQKGNEVTADLARVDNATSTAVCTGVVKAQLRKVPTDEPTNVDAESLTIEGKGAAKGESTTPTVTFDADHLVVRSRRNAVLSTSQVRIVAPTIGFDPASGTSVIGGPKTIHLTPKEDPNPTTPPKKKTGPVKITCEGIAVMDRAAGLIQLERAVRLVGPEFTLDADRALITLDPVTNGIKQLRARGNVMIRQQAGQTISCESVDYDGVRTMKIEGAPRASIRKGQSDLICERAVIDTESEKLTTERTGNPIRITIKRAP